MELPPFPTLDSLYARLATTRERAHGLISLKPSRAAMKLARLAIDDLNEVGRLLQHPAVGEKPHMLRAADACIEVALWRLRGVEKTIDEGAT